MNGSRLTLDFYQADGKIYVSVDSLFELCEFKEEKEKVGVEISIRDFIKRMVHNHQMYIQGLPTDNDFREIKNG